MAITLRINEVNNKSGNLKNLNFAIPDSMMAITTQNKDILIANTKTENNIALTFNETAIPKGKNTLAPIDINIKSFIADAHSKSASRFPEYSIIIAS